MVTADPQTEPDAVGATPRILVGVSFADRFRAQEFLTAAAGLAAAGSLSLVDAVTVTKTQDGKTTVHETTDLEPRKAAVSGAVWAGLFGLVLGGPVGWAAGLAVGAGVGAITAKIVDTGISDEWVEWFRSSVEPGRVVVALLVEHLDDDALVQEAARFTGAELVYANLDAASLDRIASALAP